MESTTSCKRCDARKEFANEITVSENDTFSNLPDDCIFFVLSFLNHYDLDVISTVSQKMHILADHSKSKVGRSPRFREMGLIPSHDLFSKIIPGLNLTLTGSKNAIKITAKIEHDHATDPIPHSLLHKIDSAIRRFEIDEVWFAQVHIDNCFLAHCERWTNLGSLALSYVKFDEDCQRNTFTDWLLKSRVRYISLYDSGLGDQIDQSFIHKLSQNVANPELIVQHEPFKGVKMQKSTVESLSLYKEIHIPHMEVNTDWVMDAFIKRLRRNISGSWSLVLSTEITSADILSSAVSELDYVTTPREQAFEVRIMSGPRLQATLKSINNKLDANFYTVPPLAHHI